MAGTKRSADAPRVTLGIATAGRDTYLAEAIRSSLEQDYESFEVLVVDDGSSNPAIAEVLASFDDPRLRMTRHPENRGIAEAYNTIVAEGRGELIAMLGDDDVCLPGRLSREVAIFDAHPDTGVVHGDALITDAQGTVTGSWASRDFTPAELMRCLVCDHNYLVDPTRMVHRRVYEAVGGYDPAYPLAQDFHFWLRAAPRFRFRHCPGGPLICFRRHGENGSDESRRDVEVAEVQRALEETIERTPLRELVPELDWSVLEPQDAERQALERLASHLERRALPLPGLAARVRARAGAVPARPRRPRHERGRLMMTSFGWNDSGGGTTVPRLAAKELARRGWEVTVFHAATRPTPSGTPYEVVESEEDGVRLIAVHNRAHGIWDLGNPLRELDDPPITAAFAEALERLRPDVVHFHNLHNLGAALIDEAAARGLPAFFTTHNYWLICPRAYLMTGTGELCAGPGDGERCAACVGSPDGAAHRARLELIRARATRGLSACLAVSEAVRGTLISAGYPGEMIDVVRQGMPHDMDIWERLGRERAPGRADSRLTVGFLGSAYPHKGPQLLVRAAQRTSAELRVQIHGEIPDAFAAELRELDARGVVELCGAFHPSEIDRVLATVDVAALPSTWWDCAPLVAAECLAARVPLVVPRLGGIGEAITDEVNGLLFDALDVDDLARCLDRLAGEQGLLERLQSAIRAPRPFADYVDQLESYYERERPGRATKTHAPQADVLSVRWKGDHGLRTSLSIVNDRVGERLHAGVQRVARDGTPLDAPLPRGADVEVRHQWPPDLSAPRAARLAVIQPWEFGAVPRAWVMELQRNVDELWVPSQHVRGMYVAAGLEPERVVVIPNGVDLECFRPDGDAHPLGEDGDGREAGTGPRETTRFLFVGGLISRKGADVLFDAYAAAFAGRDDVALVVKGAGQSGVYREDCREAIAAHARAGKLPRIELVDDELSEAQMAALYRACDVLVHPYRGEGFAMPVLEAMACGLPVIVTEGGPTDEFCPPQAGSRIRSTRSEWALERVADFETCGRPWMLEPDAGHLAELMHTAAASPDDSRGRARAARAAAERYGWDAVAALYDERLAALASAPRTIPLAPRELEEDVALRVLATPAWRGMDRLEELLREWAAATSAEQSACLYLLADQHVDGSAEELQRRVLAAGVDLDGAADVTVLMDAISGDRDVRLHASVDAYVPLHAACEGHLRMAAAAGNAIIALGGDELARLLAGAGGRAAVSTAR